MGPKQPVEHQQFRPPPAPLTGANTQMLPPQPRPAVQQQPQQQQLLAPPPADVNYVGNNRQYQGRNQYQEYHESYVIFVSEPTDRLSQNRDRKSVV